MKYVLSLAQEPAQEPVNHTLLHALLELMDSLDPWLLQSKLCAAVEMLFSLSLVSLRLVMCAFGACGSGCMTM